MILYYQQPELAELAGQLVDVLNIPSVCQLSSALPATDCYVYLSGAGLFIHTPLFKPFNCYEFYADLIKRRRPGLSSESLLQAVKLKVTPNEPVSLLDLTAGLGRDAVIFALAGFQVTAVEQNPYLALVLAYLAQQFADQFPGGLQIVHGEHSQYLTNSSNAYDVIYWDPMFNDGKSALAKKDMQLIDYLLGLQAVCSAEAPETVFPLVKQHCRQKIVIKRDNKQASLVKQPKPTYAKAGKTIRFDVYQSSQPTIS